MLLVRGNNDLFGSLPDALSDIDKDWEKSNGIIVCGSHVLEKLDEKLDAIRYAYNSKTPYLGICFGLQLMAVWWARQKGLDCDSSEINPATPHQVVSRLPVLRVGIRKVDGEWESHWHNYALNPAYIDLFKDDFDITLSEDGIVEVLRHKTHPFFVGVQFHPEYRTKHPILEEFLLRSRVV